MLMLFPCGVEFEWSSKDATLIPTRRHAFKSRSTGWYARPWTKITWRYFTKASHHGSEGTTANNDATREWTNLLSQQIVKSYPTEPFSSYCETWFSSLHDHRLKLLPWRSQKHFHKSIKTRREGKWWRFAHSLWHRCFQKRGINFDSDPTSAVMNRRVWSFLLIIKTLACFYSTKTSKMSAYRLQPDSLCN